MTLTRALLLAACLWVFDAFMSAYAVPTQLDATWDAYEYADATIDVECQRGTGAFASVGTTPAARGSLAFTLDLAFGERINCRALAKYGDKESPRSEVAVFQLPFPELKAPSALRLRVR